MRTYTGRISEKTVDAILSEHTPDDFLAMDHLHGEFYDYIMERIWRFLNA